MAASVEVGEGDEVVGVLEPVGDPGEEPQLGVRRLDQPVRQVVQERLRMPFMFLVTRRARSTKAGIRDRRAQAIWGAPRIPDSGHHYHPLNTTGDHGYEANEVHTAV